MDWQPIETAPRDGETPNVLLCRFEHEEDYSTSITVGFWSAIDAFGGDPREGWCDWCAGMDEDDYWKEFHPTHWMPLPAPP